MGPTGFNKLGLDLGEGEPIGLGLEKTQVTLKWLRVQIKQRIG